MPNTPVFLTIAQSIRRDILFGNLFPGTSLNEKETAKRFETSRAPVRESLRILEGEGLIVRAKPVGYKVREFNLDEFIERNTLLKIIEREMLLLAIPRYTELHLCHMERMLDSIAESKNIEEFITNLIRFNEMILEPTGWDFSIELVRQILFHTVPYFRDIANRYMVDEMGLDTHRKFIALCREGKTEEAIDCWIVRFADSGRKVYAYFNELKAQVRHADGFSQ